MAFNFVENSLVFSTLKFSMGLGKFPLFILTIMKLFINLPYIYKTKIRYTKGKIG